MWVRFLPRTVDEGNQREKLKVRTKSEQARATPSFCNRILVTQRCEMNTPRTRKRLTEKSVYRFLNRCNKEIKACEATRAHLAEIILNGAAPEYILTAWIRAFDVPRRGRRKLTDRWDLIDLINRAYEVKWFDRKAYLAAQRIRKFRNLVHPNWYAGRKPIRFTRHILDERREDLSTAVNSLYRNL
jgi:hypothetical protein